MQEPVEGSEFRTLQTCVRYLMGEWSRRGKWVTPDIQDAVSFLVTEAGEALDECLRMKNYVRNHPQEEDPGLDRLKEEIADVVVMALVSACILDFSLRDQVLWKLTKMDQKRR